MVEAHDRSQYEEQDRFAGQGGQPGWEADDATERQRETERRAKGGRGVLWAIIALVLLGAVAAGVWWAYTNLAGPRQSDVVGAVDGYFRAGALNDRAAADLHVYMGEDAASLNADDFSGEFVPETFFAYRGVNVRHFFAGEDGAYVFGLIEYNERPSREFTAVLKQRADGNWGLLRLDLSEPLTG